MPYPATWTFGAVPLTHLGIPPKRLGWEASLHLLWLLSAHFCKSRCTCAQCSMQFADLPSTSENQSQQGAWVGEEQKVVKLRNFCTSCALQCLSVESIFFVFLLSKLRLKFNLNVLWSRNTLGMNLIKQPVLGLYKL